MKVNQAGYSVFEVLIAFVIMAMVLTALIPGQARLLLRASEANGAVLAQDLAASRMAHWGMSTPLEVGETLTVHGEWDVIETITPAGDGLVTIDVQVLSARGSMLASLATTRVLP